VARAEVLCIGTELLLGDVLDTNSQFLAQQLALLGLNCFYRVTVGDNPERIRECIAAALTRSDVLITSGGLGPTADDLTTECIAQVFGVPLEQDEDVLRFIEGLFSARGLKMPPSNAKQALRPRGAQILPNPVGSAPGIIWRLGPQELAVLGLPGPDVGQGGSADPLPIKSILTFPGVPSELKGMWAETARGYLEATYAGGTIWSKELKHYGIGESALAEKYAHLLALANPTVAPYAGSWECRLRVAAKAATVAEAQALAQPVIDEIKAGSGVRCYGEDSDTLESVVGQLLVSKGLTIALAESCTGGMVSERLTNIPGSSRYIMLNAVAYSNEAKRRVLGVSEEIIETHGSVSPECAKAMALGIRQVTSCDLGLSVTGIAGPEGGTEAKPIGLVYLGLSATGEDGEGRYFAKTLRLGKRLGRHEVRWRTAQEALNMVRLYLISPEHIEG
jgi:nicotinamide-nucleotide amidase